MFIRFVVPRLVSPSARPFVRPCVRPSVCPYVRSSVLASISSNQYMQRTVWRGGRGRWSASTDGQLWITRAAKTLRYTRLAPSTARRLAPRASACRPAPLRSNRGGGGRRATPTDRNHLASVTPHITARSDESSARYFVLISANRRAYDATDDDPIDGIGGYRRFI